METKPATIDINGRTVKPFYTPELKQTVFSEIIDRLMQGESISTILKSDTGKFPTAVSFFNWLDKDPQMQKAYRYAREVQSHALFDELLHIAKGDNNECDSVVKVQRDRLITDTMKFYIAKVLPKVYGEKVDITSNGEALNIVSLGVGIAPSPAPEQQYIDITDDSESTE